MQGATSTHFLSTCDGMTLKPAFDGTNKFLLFVGSLPLSTTGIRQITCHPSDASKPDIVLNALPWLLQTDMTHSKRVTWEDKPGDILYVRFWEFGQKTSGRWSPEQEQLLEILSSLKHDRKLLLDLRSVQTGDSLYASLIARVLSSKTSPPDLKTKGLQKMSLYTRAGQVSMMNRLVFNPNQFGPSTQTKADNIRTRDRVQNLLSDLEKNGFTLDTLQTREFAIGDSAASIALRNIDYNQPIVVLTNQACGSTCGMALAELRNHPKVQFVGTNSGGNLHFMSPGVFMLPNSRIKMELSPTSLSYSPDFPDAIGFIPDLYILAVDPVTAALTYLQSL